VLSKFRAFVVKDFDLVSGILEREIVKQSLITKTRKGEDTKEEGSFRPPLPFFVLSKFRSFVVNGFEVGFMLEEPEETPYHENTKGGKHERRRGYLNIIALFRAFQISCFRDCFLLLQSMASQLPSFLAYL
jgi:hypothetical protein